MSLTLKFTSLIVRTAAKPISNYIKHQAREHERFRNLCVSFAQQIHRLDMRLRLGLLQDPAVIERQIARAEREAEAKRKKEHPEKTFPTVKTKEQTEADTIAREKEKKEISDKVKARDKERSSQMQKMIRPLSEGKAIDSGATFISETFLFIVAGGLILFESWRGRKKDQNRRADVNEKLESLEEEIKKAQEEDSLRQQELIALRMEVERLRPNNSLEGGVNATKAGQGKEPIQKSRNQDLKTKEELGSNKGSSRSEPLEDSSRHGKSNSKDSRT